MMVAPIYTHLPVPTNAPSCSSCDHYKLRRGLPIFGTDQHPCSHPHAIHKVTGHLADAYIVRMSARQNQCNVDGVWWTAREPARSRTGQIIPGSGTQRPLAPTAPANVEINP